VSGTLVREASGTASQTEATRLLKRREGAAAEGRQTSTGAAKVTLGELLDDLEVEYQANERDLGRLRVSLAHVRPSFNTVRAARLTTSAIRSYTVARQHEGAAAASINRELAAIKRACSLAMQATPPKLYARPYIPILTENNTREGFFEREQFEAVRRHLPEELRPLVTVAYITGWRVPKELLPLTWARVDFKAGTLRLDPGKTKNRKEGGRVFPMTPELRRCLEAQRAATDEVQKRNGAIIPFVFHRDGQPIRCLDKTWHTACQEAGVSGRLMHDFRRSAIRNLERAGVPRSVAMKMVGHKTEAVYRRYAIVNEGDLVEAAAKLARLEPDRSTSSARISARQADAVEERLVNR
jgi:integrase